MINIDYYTDVPQIYADAIFKAETHNDLLAVLRSYGHLALDALDRAMELDKKSFFEFRQGVQLEKRKVFAGEKWASRYAVILMPKQMAIVAMMAKKHSMPFGTVYIRMKDDGYFDK